MKMASLSVPFPGAKRPLEEGAKLGLWEFILLKESRTTIPPADIYILAAWHPIYERLMGLSSNSKIGILWTSSSGEMDLESIEQEYLRSILIDPRITFVWFGDESLAQAYPEKSFYAPYPFYVDDIRPSQSVKQDIITLFCPTGPKKNILNQLLAVKLVQKERKLVLHTNITGYDRMLEQLDHVRHGWLPEDEYRRLIASARVNLACSWCETYNYQVAEAALMNTPSVVSPTISLPGYMIHSPNSPREIARGITQCMEIDYSEVRERVLVAIERNNHALKLALQKELLDKVYLF